MVKTLKVMGKLLPLTLFKPSLTEMNDLKMTGLHEPN